MSGRAVQAHFRKEAPVYMTCGRQQCELHKRLETETLKRKLFCPEYPHVRRACNPFRPRWAFRNQILSPTMCWRRLLRVPWTARISKQSILKEINPECPSEGLMPKLKLQYFGQLVWRAGSLEKTLMLGKTEDRRRGGRQRMRWLDGITNLTDMNSSKLWEIVKDRGA